MTSFLGIIPARFKSTRFPGKPLADIKGKPMIRHVFERASAVMDRVIVATDDRRIATAVQEFGGEVIMTSTEHQSGTDRCAEALGKAEEAHGTTYDVVVNIQGDEPFLAGEQIRLLQSCFSDENTQIATLIKKIENEGDIRNPNRAKVVVEKNGFALYFSRSPIPFLRNAKEQDWHTQHAYYMHIGLYAYRSEVLRTITRLDLGSLEKAEALEQLRWLQNGFRIKTAVTEHDSFGIDTPEDLQAALDSGLI